VTDTLEQVRTYQQFIGGEFVDAASGETLDVVNPARDEVVARVPKSGAEDVDRAANAAAKAFETWSQTTPQERSLALLKLADAVEARADELGRLEASHTGKPTGIAIDEMAVVADLFRFFGGACRQMQGVAVTEYLAGHTSMIRRDPVGPVASIAPWNYPLYMAAWKLGPALATGNTCVLKPSARTPLTALLFAQLAAEHFPAGVVNVLSGAGSDIGDQLVTHPRIRMISITGDTVTGKHVARLASDSLKRLHLELGGKCPVIIFDDADLDLAAESI
jgi:acyl-CoA reductase-like NAD-dependent aldehyde dehydrogenase